MQVRSIGALPLGGSALGAVAEAHDTVAEPVLVQQLQLAASIAGERGLALTNEHRTSEEVALIDQPGIGICQDVIDRALSCGSAPRRAYDAEMLFSAHLADTTVLAGLRRRAPKSGDVPGLRDARNATCAPFTAGVLPRPQLRRECLMAVWDDEPSLDAFLDENPTGRVFADGWHARMELVRAVGVWPGLSCDMAAEAGDKSRGMTGPSIAITIGTAYLRTIIPFTKVNSGLEDQFIDTPGGMWGTLMTNLPKRMVATLTIWEDSKAALDYMRSGAHGQAIRDHYDPAKDPTGHRFVTGGGFFGFRPLATSGSLAGRNALNGDLLAI